MEAINDRLKIHRVPTLVEPGVYRFKATESDLYARFANLPIYFIHDLGDEKMIPLAVESPAAKHLVVSSPNARKLADFKKYQADEKILLLDQWSLEEMLQIKDPMVNQSIIKERFVRMGGKPRWVTDKIEGVSEKVQDAQIRNLPSNILNLVISSKIFVDLPGDIDNDVDKQTDLIFSMQVAAERNTFKMVLASDYVGRELGYRFAAQRSLI
jgi:hypothetical protein